MLPPEYAQERQLWRAGSHLRSIIDSDGGLILDLKTGRFHSLNTTSAVVWEMLRQDRNGLESAEIMRRMAALFGSQPRMADDLRGLMRSLEGKGLVYRNPNDSQGTHYTVPSSGDIHRRPALDESTPEISTMECDLSSTQFINRRGDGSWTCAAWLCFLAVYLILQIGGFSRLHKALRWLSAKRPVRVASQEKIFRVCVAVNKAATYFLRKSWCLHRAAVTFSLLRLAGMPAELVIGCRRVPFYSHAWVEIHRAVVNEDSDVKALYPELDRI